MDKGYIQVYTGNGKGKTTCMLGLTLRAVGSGKRVYIGQFMKDDDYSEITALKTYLPMVTVEQYGAGKGFIRKDNIPPDQIDCAKSGYSRAMAALTGGSYDIVILDEINVAAFFTLLTEAEVLALMEAKPETVELVLTGRYAAQSVIDRADLVTEMTEVKHYYEQGVMARVGIEK